MRRVLAFDSVTGQIEMEAGIQWPAVFDYLEREQAGAAGSWGVKVKQTGADRLSLGGALAANVHGRGLTFKPIIEDVVSFTLVDAAGDLHTCSRTVNADLFRLAIGGYGLFGPIATVCLQLAPRRKVERVVEVIDAADLPRRFRERIDEGFLYGDFQYATARDSDDLLRRGLFACYRPVPDDAPIDPARRMLSTDAWVDLIRLAHVDRGEAFRQYARHYLATSGQIYWSDLHQTTEYIDDYHTILGPRVPGYESGTEMITEVYVPRDVLPAFLEAVRADVVANRVELIYGTIRLVETDDESFLAWARQPWACVIFNLHVEHDPAGKAKAKDDFLRLIDRTRRFGGSYFLTYHRWATREQVLACHPRMPEFLRRKRRFDPDERFQSDWYRHYRDMFGA